ncbi:DUF2490 domain-containing protein [Yeosuana sp. AK3]
MFKLSSKEAVSIKRSGFFIKIFFEIAIFVQISYKYKLSNLTVYSELRLENRFLNDLYENITLNKIRYQFRNSIALNKSLFIVLSDEVFANLQDKVFTENRLYAGVGIQILKSKQHLIWICKSKNKWY